MSGMNPKAPSPWPPRVHLYANQVEHPGFAQEQHMVLASAKPRVHGIEDTTEYLCVSEHTHLLVEAVREAKAQVWDEAAKIEHFEGISHTREIFRQKASELRKGATPENGGK